MRQARFTEGCSGVHDILLTVWHDFEPFRHRLHDCIPSPQPKMQEGTTQAFPIGLLPRHSMAHGFDLVLWTAQQRLQGSLGFVLPSQQRLAGLLQLLSISFLHVCESIQFITLLPSRLRALSFAKTHHAFFDSWTWCLLVRAQLLHSIVFSLAFHFADLEVARIRQINSLTSFSTCSDRFGGRAKARSTPLLPFQFLPVLVPILRRGIGGHDLAPTSPRTVSAPVDAS
mmetsp:Transcript_3654/g.22890  ORF Transcript_3654/g.22890 Transcript_3654/m.22890 type:complete len:228 (-) Transcript_3654:152-835(-)